MGEVLLWKLADVAFTLVEAGMARDTVVSAMKAKEEAGATPVEVLAFLHNMRDEAKVAAHKAVAAQL